MEIEYVIYYIECQTRSTVTVKPKTLSALVGIHGGYQALQNC